VGAARFIRSATPSPHPIPIHDNDAVGNVFFGQLGENVARSRAHFAFAPIAIAEQNQTWLVDACDCEQARIVEISGDDRSCLVLRVDYDLAVGGTVKP
jgi:hypothetical protein